MGGNAKCVLRNVLQHILDYLSHARFKQRHGSLCPLQQKAKFIYKNDFIINLILSAITVNATY